ncbi:MAG: NAD(P)-dependent oxidoreductase [Anaerolineae bacterium]
MRIAVTGGSGRIGRAITRMALADGHSVVSIDRVHPGHDSDNPNLVYVDADMVDYTATENALRGCDGLIHMAAIPSPHGHPAHIVHNNNVVGSYNALTAAVEVGITHVCQASSVNATGAAYSRRPRYDYFPLDEEHPTYNEDPYSLSKWICEEQGDSIARRHENMTIASMRFHWVVQERAVAVEHARRLGKVLAKHLWGYTVLDRAARACLSVMTADYKGHEVFYIIAPHTTEETPSLDLAGEFFPNVPIRGDLSGTRGFFDCSKAERLLGWLHDQEEGIAQ